MLTFERRLVGELIAERPGLMGRPKLAVLEMTTSTGAVGADYDTGFPIGQLAEERAGFRIAAVCACELLSRPAMGRMLPAAALTVWTYGDDGKLRGWNLQSAKEVDQTTDVPPGSVLRIVVFGS